MGRTAPLTAAATIRNYISRLRRRLRPGPDWPDRDVIKLVGDGYTLRLGPALLDFNNFEKLTGHARAARGEGDPARAAALFGDALRL